MAIRTAWLSAALGALAIGLYALSRVNFLAFHGLIELYGIACATSLFVIAWSSRHRPAGGYLVVLGAAMLPVAATLSLHVFAYEGMGVFTGYSASLSSQLWLISRYVLAAGMVAAPLCIGRRVSIPSVLTVSGAASALLLLTVFAWRIFPDTLDPVTGLTRFKIWSEYGVVAALGISLLLLARRRTKVEPFVFRFVVAATVAFIVAELLFTVYTDVYGFTVFVAHVAQATGFHLLAAAVVAIAILRPQEIVFRELKQNEQRLERANRILSILSAAKLAVAIAIDERELFSAMCAVAVDACGCRTAWIGEAVEEDGRRVVVPVVVCGDEGYLDEGPVTWDDAPTGTGPVGTAIRTGQEMVVRDVEGDQRVPARRGAASSRGYRAVAALPIEIGGKRFGALCLYGATPASFDDDEMALMRELRDTLERAIESLRLVAQREAALAEVEQSRARLEELVAERTAELDYTIAGLRSANAAKGDFLRNMSHELRTPLNSIIGFSGIMRQGLAGPLSEEQVVQLDMIGRSGKQLLGLVSQLLDFARIEEMTPALQRREFRLGDLVESVAATARTLAHEKSLEFTSAMPEEDLVLVSDEAKVRQILLSLIGNAVKFTERGSVALDVTRVGADRLAFAVRDSGIGIPAEELGRVMEEFHQIPLPDGMKPAGTGLGLPISRSLTRALGGTLAVESVPGHGSVFTLTIPMRSPEPATGADPGFVPAAAEREPDGPATDV